MNRLTQDGVDVCRDLCEYFDECTSRKLETPIICLKAATYNNLRAYERTGLEPEEIEKATSVMVSAFNLAVNSGTEMLVGRLKEIIRAEAEGRIVVLPCKVGDTVFYNDTYGNVYEAIVQSIVIDKSRTIFITSGIGFDETTVGKTVFLTREEAEAALKEADDG